MAKEQMLVSLAKEIMEYTVHAFGNGTLTTNGVQYGTSMAATSTDTWKTVATYTINPVGSTELNEFGTIGAAIEIEFNLTTHSQHSGTSTGTVTYNWQARNLSDTDSTAWVGLLPTATGHSTAAGATATGESTYSGYMTISSTLNEVPLQVRLLVMSGGGSTNGDSATGAYARAKNSSYIRVLYRVV